MVCKNNHIVVKMHCMEFVHGPKFEFVNQQYKAYLLKIVNQVTF